MKKEPSLIRKSHFLGTKVRNLRKRNHLTLEDLSARCIRIDPSSAPSVSYLSMIEQGKRTPSMNMLENLSTVFQKPVEWFLDNEPEPTEIIPTKGNSGGISGMALEPNFLFSKDILQIAIPEMLSQAGISGRQFAHLLIRAHQEHHQNHFPDLERAAEEIGGKDLHLQPESLLVLLKQQGYQYRWFGNGEVRLDGIVLKPGSVVTSYFVPPNQVFINEKLKAFPARLKYDIAVHIGHAVLHHSDGVQCVLTTGGLGMETDQEDHHEPNAQDILNAWRDFESSFFAGALLCPKVPYRQVLERHGYDIGVHEKLGISASVAMRRMTVVSPYPHWHYFDAYQPGKLKAVYRGNGIPLPWGNMREVPDPCQHWAVFRKFASTNQAATSQLSILNVNNKPRLYCCESVSITDLAEQPHILCAGIDLNPAIAAQGLDADSVVGELQQLCIQHGGSSQVPYALAKQLERVAKILNINWIEKGLESDVRVICTRGSSCPRKPTCYEAGQCEG
ncbi:DUF3612 domain-containing protein [Pseudoalteromonas xiamenensis]|uniref:DUF3612 domain-containing protein n=1 Tax=Pseudoalteromonas xiamenensis TaxID=882626 RepID=A0A975DL96_9GAMM|nr:DUF3612 domain-containing protein [Pseudoalteromonas xiamenensis]QTH73594.1 DUF3612 domain-containing protein [Pseudoalteromonas xiamenensis]